jgi:NTE family protein
MRFDFTREGIRVRWSAGYDDTRRVLAERPWEKEVDPMAGVAVYDSKPARLTFATGHAAT